MPPRPEHVRVVVVTMFPSELQPWKERFGFDVSYEFEGASHPLLFERSGEVLLMLAGVGATEAAANVMALGLDPRFDLSDAYVLVIGIAGGTPDAASLGSIVVGDWVVDTDLAQEIDARDLDQNREHAKTPLFKPRYELPPGPNRGEATRLDTSLARRVVEVARAVELADPPELAAMRDEYDAWPVASKAPEVMLGAIAAGSTMWHGSRMNEWATAWVSYWTEGASVFAASSMEDAGVVTALRRLAAARKISFRRVVVVRSICNFTVEPRGLTAAQSLEREGASAYSAIAPAVENAYRVGSAITRFLVASSLLATKPAP